MPFIGQFAHPHAQEDLPAFLFLKCFIIISAAIPNTTAATIIVPRLYIIHCIENLLSGAAGAAPLQFSGAAEMAPYIFTLSLSASLYGFASIYTTKTIIAAEKIKPTTFRLPVKIEPIWKIHSDTAYASTHW